MYISPFKNNFYIVKTKCLNRAKKKKKKEVELKTFY